MVRLAFPRWRVRSRPDRTPDGGPRQAIMTTGLRVSKQASASGPGVDRGGMARGAGMSPRGSPRCSAALTTDAVMAPDALAPRLRGPAATFRTARTRTAACPPTTPWLMSSGASGTGRGAGEFTRALTAVCHSLCAAAHQLHAEGASHDIAHHHGGRGHRDGGRRTFPGTVARSNLLKTAVSATTPTGAGRSSAAGTTQAQLTPTGIDVTINGVTVCRNGGIGDPREGVDLAASRAVDIVIDLKTGTPEPPCGPTTSPYDTLEENSAYSS
ncbi:bifunctional ornithine acetyltransferase/N-acetylglutamate synthase [Kocuria rhizophila]|nr:bifunctional ornithine acetyltransferase/N-acetylglutamate synthase [Kocuria rhizophila]